MKAKCTKIIAGINQYFETNNIKKAVIGLSGGIDSSLSAKLVADAIGKENLTGLILPDEGVTSKESIDLAIKLAKQIGISYETVPINEITKSFNKMPWKSSHMAEINTKSRARALIIYNYANTHNAIVIGTSNKTEILIGYFTKYGDGAVDIEVIGSLWKTEVFEMSKMLNLPEEIIKRPPTAELYHGHTDEKEIGADYPTIDRILKQIESGEKPTGKIAERIIGMMKSSEHKRKKVPVIKS